MGIGGVQSVHTCTPSLRLLIDAPRDLAWPPTAHLERAYMQARELHPHVTFHMHSVTVCITSATRAWQAPHAHTHMALFMTPMGHAGQRGGGKPCSLLSAQPIK